MTSFVDVAAEPPSGSTPGCPPLAEPGDLQQQEICWICLEGSTQEHQLHGPCACPRLVHMSCLGRWQLQSAGRREENQCRFCQQEYPSWVTSLTPPHLQPVTARVQPWMAVVCGDKTVKIPVRPGPEGREEFRQRIKQAFNFPPDSDFEISFECKAPTGGENLRLHGIQCFDAATHCAAISAAKRVAGMEEWGAPIDFTTAVGATPSAGASSETGTGGDASHTAGASAGANSGGSSIQ